MVEPPPSFLRACRQRPWDDTPRLIMADWLEENGDPDRAEFIRLQCQLAGGLLDLAERDAMRAREGELLARHAGAWFGPFANWGGGEYRFRRGFIEASLVPPRLLPAFTPWLAHVYLPARPVEYGRAYASRAQRRRRLPARRCTRSNSAGRCLDAPKSCRACTGHGGAPGRRPARARTAAGSRAPRPDWPFPRLRAADPDPHHPCSTCSTVPRPCLGRPPAIPQPPWRDTPWNSPTRPASA